LNPRPEKALRQHLHVCFVFTAYRLAENRQTGFVETIPSEISFVKRQESHRNQGAGIVFFP